MHTAEIPDINYKAEYASCIEELTPEQFRFFIKLLLLWERDEINHHDFKNLLIIKLLDIKMNPRIVKKYGLTEAQEINMFLLGESLDSFFTETTNDEGVPVKHVNLSFTRNMVPTIRMPWHMRKLIGPNDALDNITFHEYMHAQGHFNAFVKSQNDADLNRLIAVLYRPAKYFSRFRKATGDKRREYNEHEVELRAKDIAKLPREVRYGVFVFFRAMEEFLKTGSIDVNGTEVSFKVLYTPDTEGESSGANLGWVGVLYSLAESGTFGNTAETAKQNLYDVLLRIYQVVIAARELNEKAKNDTDKRV